MRALSGTTKVLGIIGNPVEHSLSTQIQNAAINASGLDYVYVPFSVTPESLGAAISGLMALGVSGFNVTIPHKTAVISYLDELDESAKCAGAVNTVKLSNGRLIGYNTDGDGFVSSLAADLDYVIGGCDTIILIGAGGATRGAVAALCRAGAGRIVLVNRTFHKAVELAEEMSDRYPNICIESSLQDQVSDYYLGSASLLVNTTSMGMNGERLGFINLLKLPKSAKVYDMVYSPTETLLMQEAVSTGLTAVNGLGMLAAQGELAFSIWTGKTPPKGLMKLVLQSICAPNYNLTKNTVPHSMPNHS